MRYSIVLVENEYDGLIDGIWMQDHHGDLSSVTKKVNDTQLANSSKLSDGSQMQIAAVEWLGDMGGPNYSVRKGLKRLV